MSSLHGCWSWKKQRPNSGAETMRIPDWAGIWRSDPPVGAFGSGLCGAAGSRLVKTRGAVSGRGLHDSQPCGGTIPDTNADCSKRTGSPACMGENAAAWRMNRNSHANNRFLPIAGHWWYIGSLRVAAQWLGVSSAHSLAEAREKEASKVRYWYPGGGHGYELAESVAQRRKHSKTYANSGKQ